MTVKWQHPYFGQKVKADAVPIESTVLLMSMMGMQSEVERLTTDKNRQRRERLEVIIKEMSQILNEL